MSVYRCKYFKIEELVCNHVMANYGEGQQWSFLDENLKKTIDIIHEILDTPLTINQPASGRYQCGMRCHLCDLVKTSKSPYISAHVQGKAVDLHLTPKATMSAEEARLKIQESAYKLPCNIRFEHLQKGEPIGWIHVDVRDNAQDKKVVWFDV